jgi:hypothetical protein
MYRMYCMPRLHGCRRVAMDFGWPYAVEHREVRERRRHEPRSPYERMRRSSDGQGWPSGFLFQTNPKYLHPCRQCRGGHNRRDAGGRTNQETESRNPRAALPRTSVCGGGSENGVTMNSAFPLVEVGWKRLISMEGRRY